MNSFESVELEGTGDKGDNEDQNLLYTVQVMDLLVLMTWGLL